MGYDPLYSSSPLASKDVFYYTEQLCNSEFSAGFLVYFISVFLN
jgi:hypothetical protein